MNPDTLKYLQQDDVGKVIAQGLATLYRSKPDKPIRYLAQWLRSHSTNSKAMAQVVQSRAAKANNLKIYQENNKLASLLQDEQQKKIKDKQGTIEQFKQKISQNQYLEELLEETLPEFIEKHTDITGAYVGELNYPPRAITEEDTDQQAHLNTAAEKVINYIGSSVSHKSLMRGQMLKLTEGVTGKVFSLEENGQQPPEGQNAESAPPAKSKYIYIPNVVKNDSMHFFRIPKLGAYLSVPLIYYSYLNDKVFDEALQARNKYIANFQEFKEKKTQQLQDLNVEKEDLTKKLTELKEKNGEEAQIEATQAELKEVQARIQEKQGADYPEPEPELSLQKRCYAVCVDNLGKDRQLQAQDIDFIVDIMNHFRQSWQKKQKQLINKDVQIHIDLTNSLPEQPSAIKEKLEKQLQIDEQASKQFNEIQDENLKAYKQEQWQFNKLKNAIKQNEQYLAAFLKLKQFRVIKYRDVIQSVLYFLGYSKAEVNLPGKAVLNWKEVKNKYITHENYNKILAYVVQGPKDAQFRFYAKTPVLADAFDNFPEDEIFKYNIGLGAIVKFIKAALKHRISNVELRKAQKEVERKHRESVIEENEKIAAEKAQELERRKAALAPEDLESYKEEEEALKYDEQNPAKDVPPEIVQDIDNDM